jgi:hypothetical protein
MRRLLPLLSAPFSIILMAIIIVVLFRFVAHAAELGGLQIPDTLQVDGKILHLNGFGRRSYSIFNIHIYVASLYLEHFNTNPDEIIRSPETKLLTVRFERSITADRARQAWRENFKDNCMAPCHLDPGDVERFLSEVPAMHVGDSFYLLLELAQEI